MKVHAILAASSCLLFHGASANYMQMMGKGKGKGKGKGTGGHGFVGSVQLGSRPFWLVDEMKDSFLKKELGTYVQLD